MYFIAQIALLLTACSSRLLAQVDYPCFVVGQTATYSAQTPARTVTLVGTGAQQQCALLTFQLLEKNVPCWAPESCSFLGVYQPPLLTQEVQPLPPIPDAIAPASWQSVATKPAIRALGNKLARSHTARLHAAQAAQATQSLSANAAVQAPTPVRTQFFGFSNYGEIAESCFLEPNATLLQWQARAREICATAAARSRAFAARPG